MSYTFPECRDLADEPFKSTGNFTSVSETIDVLRKYLDEYKRGNNRIVFYTNRQMEKDPQGSCCAKSIVNSWNYVLSLVEKDASIKEAQLSIVSMKGFSSFDYVIGIDILQRDVWLSHSIYTLLDENVNDFLYSLVSTSYVYDQTGTFLVESSYE